MHLNIEFEFDYSCTPHLIYQVVRPVQRGVQEGGKNVPTYHQLPAAEFHSGKTSNL